MQTASINTTCSQCAGVVLTAYPIVQRACIMLRIWLLLCAVPGFSIIVRDPPPSPNDYKYSYDVQDSNTGDSKSQHEVRQGDVVTGAYTVVGPDGTKRTVEYTADAQHGFQAVISEEPADPPVTVTQAPDVQYQTVTSYDLNALQYEISTTRPVYVPVTLRQSRTKSFEDKTLIYFTPQKEIQPKQQKTSFENGYFFIPANN